MDKLREIQRDMAFMGWKGDPTRGFTHKEAVDGKTIARAHDATWLADYQEAEARFERRAIVREIERRKDGA